MKKKFITLFLVLTLVLSVTACSNQAPKGENSPTDTSTENVDTKNDATDSTTDKMETSAEPGTFDALEEAIKKDTETSISTLKTEMDTLVSEIDDFDKYVKNADKFELFYAKVCSESSLLGICLMEHAVTYAEFIMNSDTDFGDKYDDLDELYDVVYEDAGDEFYDSIYDGILDDMYDIFYDELLDDAYDNVPYEKWLDARSNEYEWWLDARSETYEIWLDTRSDIYEFWLDLRGATFEKDADEAIEIIADFKEYIEKLKANLQE